MTAVGSALTSAPASDRLPSSVGFASVACFLPGEAGLLSTHQPTLGGQGAGGAELLPRFCGTMLIPAAVKTSLFINWLIHQFLCYLCAKFHTESRSTKRVIAPVLENFCHPYMVGSNCAGKEQRRQRSPQEDAQSRAGTSVMLLPNRERR